MSDRAHGSTRCRRRLEWAFGLVVGFTLSAICSVEARADNICALGGTVPSGHIIYNITTSGSCSGSGTLWQTKVAAQGDWSCRPIGLDNPIPLGLVVSQIDAARSACGAGSASGTGWFLEEPQNVTGSERACAAPLFGSQVTFPPGYIVTEVGNHSSCNTGSSTLAFKIATPLATGTWGCRSGSSAIWDLPTGYVITEIDNRSVCTNGSSQLAWNIKIPQDPNTLVCVPSPVPEGWVHVTDILTHAICAASGTGSYFRISPATDGGKACSFNGIPSGFVIEDIKTSSVCGGPGYTLADLSARTGETYACLINARPPPNTYIAVETDNYSRCATSGTAVGHKVAQPDEQGDHACRHAAVPVPSNFIVDQYVNSFSRCGAGATSGLADHILVPVAGNSYTVCGSSPVPSGFLYTGSGNRSQCNNTFGYDIGPAVPGAVACDPAQIPPDFIIASISTSGLCSGNNYTVARPETGGVVTNACVGSNTPPGFVWVGRMQSYSPCDAVIGTDYKMAEPDDTVGVKTEICSGSPVPPGFVYTDYLDLGSKCEAAGVDAKITVPDPDGETIVCSLTNLPPQFVITQIIPGHSSCAGTAGARIEYPNETGQTLICSPSVPPPGYEVIATGSYAACNGGPGAWIQPVNQGVLPEAFINTEPDVPYTPPAALCPTVSGTPIVVTAPKNTAKCNW